MPDQLQLRGGTTTEHNSFTGALREVTVDTTKKTLVVHDGSQAGGTPLMKESGATAASSVQIGTGGIERFKITSSEVVFNETSTDTDFRIEGNGNANLFKVDAGNDRIGIGVASPVSDIHTVSSSDHIITHQSTTSGADIRMNFRDSGNNDQGGLHYLFNGQSMKFITGTSERMRIKGSSVIIGDTDLDNANGNFDDLIIGKPDSSTETHGLTIVCGNAASNGGIAFSDGSAGGADAYRGMISYHHNDNHMQFRTSASERMRIDSSGRLLLGTTSVGAHEGGNNFTIAESGHCGMTIRSSTSTSGNIYFADGTSSGESARGEISYGHSDDHMRFITASSEAMRIDASQRVGIGTTSPRTELDLSDGQLSFSHRTDYSIRFYNGNGNNWSSINNPQAADGGATNTSELEFKTAVGVAMHMATDGKIGIGTTSPSRLLHLQKSSDFGIRITKTGSSDAEIKNTNSLDLCCSSGGSAGQIIRMLTGANTSSLNEVMRVDGGQKVAIGTTTTTEKLIVAGAIDFTGAATGNTANSGKLSYESATAFFNSKGPDTSTRGKIGLNIAASDGSLGYNALKVQTGGQVTFGSDDTDPWNNTGNNPATVINATNVRGGLMSSAAHNGDVMALNRMGSDGAIIIFYGQGNPEGSIDVNGSTISLTGGHLTRWSKIPSISDTDKSKRPTIYRGSVLTNLDAMCEWKRVQYTNSDNITKTKPYSGSEDVGSTVEYTDDKGDKYSAKVVLELNEQLNKMEVSSVEGDPNVAGVFQGWDDDDDTIVNDLYCAMTGDFVIRIAKGVTVKRGDLLMSAGDGTAKPQDDDIIRSKTVAKVTSTTVSTTYDDGSFCVPCVLMAC